MLASLAVLPAFAALPSIESISFGARAALDRCDVDQSALWSKRLVELDGDLSTLYKLAWLQRTAVPVEHFGPGIRWPMVGEYWRDELTARPFRTRCNPGEQDIALLPEPIADELFGPTIESLSSHRFPLRKSIADYLILQWMRGHRQPLASVDSRQMGRQEICLWKGIALINDPRVEARDLDQAALKCRDRSLPWSIVQIEAGDLHFGSGHFQEALADYRNGLEYFSTREVPTPLWYRIGLSALLSRRDDDQGLRASLSVLAAQRPIAPLFQKTLTNALCERLSEVRPEKGAELIRTIVTRQDLVRTVTDLMATCYSPGVYSIADSLEKRMTDVRARTRILGLLIDYALDQGMVKAAENKTRALAALAKRNAELASRAFWRAIADHTNAKSLITIYTRNAGLLSGDASHLARWKKRTSSDVHLDKLRADRNRTGEAVTIPVGGTLPELLWREPIPIDFVALFDSDRKASQP